MIPPGAEQQKTEVLHGAEQAVSRGVEFMKRVRDRMDIFFDHRAPSIVTELPEYRNGYLDILKRGGKIRCLTDITKDNLEYCKKLRGLVTELRHFSGLKGGIAVDGKEYMATAILKEAEPLVEVIHSTLTSEVEQGQFIFDMFWGRATPAEIRIRELEEGLEPEVVQTIRDPTKVQPLEYELVNSAKQEILIIFSTLNAYHRHEASGLLPLLRELAAKMKLKIKILIPTGQMEEILNKWKAFESDSNESDVKLRFLERPLQTKMSLFVVDRSKSLTFEVRDDSKMTIAEAIGLGVYSNSKATVSSYSTIFNALWAQTELYEEIRELFGELQAQVKMQREFINVAAHELRTPIQPILGLAEVIADRMADLDFAQHRRMIDVIIRNAKRLKVLQEDVLDVTKIEGHMLDLDKKQFSLNKVIMEVMEDLKHTISEPISLVFDPQEDQIVLADRSRMAQVISNLLANAIRFTHGGTVEIDIDKDPIRKFVVIKVRDTGSGIDPDILPRLFTKFATKTGTGLGLYISKSIVEAHGGSIWAENNDKGNGATFFVGLPM